MKSRFLTILLAPILLVGLTQCTKSAADESMSNGNMNNSKSLNLSKTYSADLSPMNNSGVSGKAILVLNGNMLTVTITATGLEPNKVHPQHIHGFMQNNKKAKCPSSGADTNGDGLVDLLEGLPFYGPVLLNLTPFPTAPDGTINYTQTFTISADLLPLQNRTIVLHGLTVNGTYDATLPVACGEIKSANNMKH